MIKENWQIGKVKSTIITDSEDGFKENTGHSGDEAKKYYGGNLICESVLREKDAHLISAAPDMLEALENIENDNNQMPNTAWDMVQNAIKKAKGKNNE